MEFLIKVRVRPAGDIGVDGGSFIVLDDAYLDIAVSRAQECGMDRAVKEWFGYVANWGDGDYPLYEVIGPDNEVVGILIMQEEQGAE